MLHSSTEENYIKAIYKLCQTSPAGANTKAIADALQLKPATVTDMLNRLGEKGLVDYTRYYGVTMSEKGKRTALNIIRRHRLWEVFLVNKLNFKWDEVHDIAEELEHVSSEELIDRLDKYLGFPKADPHGDPIPDNKGKVTAEKTIALSQLAIKESGTITGVSEHSASFLRFLEKTGLTPGNTITVVEKHEFDHSMDLLINHKKELHISYDVAKNILVKNKHGK